MPSRTANELDKLANAFMWDDKPPLVKRNLLQMAVTEGGLGLPHALTVSKVLGLKTARMLAHTSSYLGRKLLLYWCSTRLDWLEVDRVTGPLAESPAPYYKAAAATARMLRRELPAGDVVANPPVRTVEALFRRQLSDEEARRGSMRGANYLLCTAAPLARCRTSCLKRHGKCCLLGNTCTS